MTNNAALNIEVGLGETKPIPQGYHNGQGKVISKATEKDFCMEKLWVNEKPTSSFAPQTIAIKDSDLSKYKILAFKTLYKADGNPNCNFSMNFLKVNSTGFISVTGTFKYPSSSQDYWPYYGSRYVEINGNNITFKEGVWRGASSGTDNAYAVPLEIYGLIDVEDEWF